MPLGSSWWRMTKGVEMGSHFRTCCAKLTKLSTAPQIIMWLLKPEFCKHKTIFNDPKKRAGDILGFVIAQ